MIETAEVEWKPLGKILERSKGTKITARQMKELHKETAPVKIFAGGKTFALVNFDDIPEKDINHEPSIIVKSRGIIEFEYYDKPFSHKNEMWSYHSKGKNIDIKFVYYFLKQNEPYFQKIGSKMQMPQIATPDTDKFLIPIPPLNLQKNIVKVLDKLTELKATLKATLKAELSLRRKQYAYYRDFLLSETELAKVGFEWKKLSDVALDFGRGKSKHRPRNDERLYGGNIPFIQTGDIRNSAHIINSYTQTYSEFGLQQSKLWKKGTLCITIAANIAETGILDFDACFPDSIIGFVADPEKTTAGYVEYLLSSLKTRLQAQSTGSAQENINLSTFDNLLLPFPSLLEQKRIVEILDKFDRLTNSISEGLPKEIELREKQYQYYREKLLNFKKN